MQQSTLPPSSEAINGSTPSGRRFAIRAMLGFLPTVSVFFLFVCGIGAFGHFWYSKEMADHMREKRPVSDFIQGREALAVERIYKDVFPTKDFSTGLLNAISFTVFGEGRNGLIKGSDGWFFSDEEFSWNRKSVGMLEKHLDFVNDTVVALRDAGIEPVLLLVPEKADIYRDKLGNIAPPLSREHYYEDVRGRLLAMGVRAPDLRAAFLQARDQEEVFLKSDTHWTVHGAGIASRSVAELLADDAGLKRKEFTLKEEPEIVHMGDLYKFAHLSIFSRFISMPGDHLTALTAVTVDTSLDDLLADDDGGAEIAIVGSSYSANSKWSFEAQLRAAAKVDVINFAEEGNGPFKPMDRFRSNTLREQKYLKYVIWEMPLRYFDEVSY